MLAALALLAPAPAGAQDPAAEAPAPVLVPVPDSGPGVSIWDGAVAPSGARTAEGIAQAEPDSRSAPLPGDLRRLHVKFDEGSAVRWTGAGLDDGVDGSALDEVLHDSAGVQVTPLFDQPRAALAAERLEGEEISGDALPDLRTWYLVTAADVGSGRVLADALADLDVVEMVQPEPTLALTAPVEEERQVYLTGAPAGVSAKWAWRRAAGTGSRVTVAVIDSGFDTNHPDLDRAAAPGVALGTAAPWDPRHGLQVLGILVADDDGDGLRGLAHGAGIRTVNSGRTSGDAANAIQTAAGVLGAGDVISISQGICAVEGCGNGIVLPLVYSSSARDALAVATARGIISVVSAGNGGANLDGYSSRLGADAPDTIVVGAGNPATGACPEAQSPPRGRVASSNYGSRVDLQGWGACVRTAGQGGGYRWWGFTSAATPIVAGSAALVSSLAEERAGVTLSGDQVRSLLEETGSAQVRAGARGGNIGPLPDIRAAIGGLTRLPANDMWAGARHVPDLPFSVVQESRWAGVQLDEPAVACGSISHTVWYRLQPAVDMELTVDTSGSDHDTVVGLWRGQGGSLAAVDCDDDISARNSRSRLVGALSAGETYYVQAGGIGGAFGRLVVNLSSADAPDVGCDVDNDGHGDLVSGSPREDVASSRDAGRALVHFGRRKLRPRTVINIVQDWPEITGSSESRDLFGAAVACGDFDGDGFDDVVVGGHGEEVDGRRGAGAVRMIPGGASGLARARAITFTQATAGIPGSVESGDRFGASLAVGDFNGDAYDDLAIGALGEDIGKLDGAGGVYVIPGGPAGLAPSSSIFVSGDTDGLPNRSEAGDAFGAALAAGDHDRDGYSDLAIGVPGEGLRGRGGAGAVYVLRGSSVGVGTAGSSILHQGTDGVPGASEAGDGFGATLAAGDIDGDRRAELLVGAPGEDVTGMRDAGVVTVFTGGKRGLRGTGAHNIHQGLAGVDGEPGVGDRFGRALAIGDVDGDGFADVAVGLPGDQVRGVAAAGSVVVFSGTSGGLATDRSQTVSQAGADVSGAPETGDRLGEAVALVDLDGDGRRDLVVGVPFEDAGSISNAGYLLLVPGAEVGVDPARSTGLTQRRPASGANEAGDRFGETLAAG